MGGCDRGVNEPVVWILRHVHFPETLMGPLVCEVFIFCPLVRFWTRPCGEGLSRYLNPIHHARQPRTGLLQEEHLKEALPHFFLTAGSRSGPQHCQQLHLCLQQRHLGTETCSVCLQQCCLHTLTLQGGWSEGILRKFPNTFW